MSRAPRSRRRFTAEGLRELEERLSEYRGPEDDPECPPRTQQAAVSVILRQLPEPELLLVKRAVAEGDPWSGHMAFPGGRRDPEDPSLLHTAVRETREETGVALDPEEGALGRLQVIAPRDPLLPRVDIVPFVFGLPGGVEARVNSPEIAGVYWVSVTQLLDPGVRATFHLRVEDTTRRFPAFQVEGEKVWGLTYRILGDLLQSLEP